MVHVERCNRLHHPRCQHKELIICFRASQLERPSLAWCNRVNCTTRRRVKTSQPHVVQSGRLHHRRPRPRHCTTALAMKFACRAMVQWRFQGQTWCNRVDCTTRLWLKSAHDPVVQFERRGAIDSIAPRRPGPPELAGTISRAACCGSVVMRKEQEPSGNNIVI